ncbi:MAG: 4-hydroxy-3-methylbut-2-en-1-yl diphosphate synthase [Candidatus Azobacteroides sp.]|nr:4-hydroxy-3-methylbut-2-en-1-yl diphosphate synthase [Candidatus Azobacteroides sp.]
MYKRRKSSVVQIGNTPMGGDYPIRVQSMTNTSTLDTDASIRQCIRIIEAGGEYVRLTAQGVREAENLQAIKDGLRALGYQTPLIADIHFNPKAAEAAAKIVEKVRINPGNFTDPVKKFKTIAYSEEEYRNEVEKIRQRFVPFLNICKEHKTAIRIGINHGSLSDRIMSRYGDTPEGMVESCMEFLRICNDENFSDVVISIKASNTFIMVKTVRLLVERMDSEGMKFPLHLGVTEAGDGEDGRIKSAVGIGTLLSEGIGDTIRVSLSEEPEAEIPVAKALLDYIREKDCHKDVLKDCHSALDAESLEKIMPAMTERKTVSVDCIGGSQPPVVISDYSRVQLYCHCELDPQSPSINSDLIPDFLYLGTNLSLKYPPSQKVLLDFSSYIPGENRYPLFTVKEQETWLACDSPLQFIQLTYRDLNSSLIEFLKQKPQSVIILSSSEVNNTYEQKAFIQRLTMEKVTNPVIIHLQYSENDPDIFRIKSAADAGSFFLDRLADGIFLRNNEKTIDSTSIDSCSFGILQATGRRISKTEYISCPSCGRTLFDLQTTLKKIKAATGHLKGLKIGVMGCIVNGPGEMADADYGYVGAGLGLVSLYKGKECIKKNIPEAEAVDELLRQVAHNRIFHKK